MTAVEKYLFGYLQPSCERRAQPGTINMLLPTLRRTRHELRHISQSNFGVMYLRGMVGMDG